MKCCGINGTEDFVGSPFRNNAGPRETVPKSCCKLDKDGENYVSVAKCQEDAWNNVTTSDNLNTIGCKEALEQLLDHNSLILLGVAVGVGAFELIIVIMGIGFCCNIKDD